MQSEMQAAFHLIKNVGVDTLSLDQELYMSWDQPGVSSKGMMPRHNRYQVTQNNVNSFWGIVDEAVTKLVNETGGITDIGDNNFNSERKNMRIPSIMDESAFASAVSETNNAADGDSVMYTSMQNFTKMMNNGMKR